ncbi:MAG: hypothetical protein K8R58_01705, partial [Bacteroidales bacterium]|nr:hypothetical protein [Bacteroidales bacterium]
MRKILTILAAVLFTATLWAQSSNDSLLWQGNYYSLTDGTYFANYNTADGCDSIYELNLNYAISQVIIINHTCEDLSQIPMSWIDSVQANQKWHYAHTSHGGQLTTGLERIENNDPAYNIARGYSTLPNVPD